MQLKDAQLKKEYIVTTIKSEDEDLNAFLFTLGCYEAQKITVISQNSSGFVVVIKDSRYSIDSELASVINVEEI